MSYFFRDPFFDGFEDFMTTMNYPTCCLEDEKKNEKRVRRDQITPFSGFGRMDMHEDEKSYTLRADLPGLEKSDIKLSLENGVLSIEGERKEEKKREEEGKYHFSERHFGSFRREMSIPSNIDESKIQAEYENGVLEVVLPKVEVIDAKKMIEVK